MQGLIDIHEPAICSEAIANLTPLQIRQIWKQIRVQRDGAKEEEISLEDLTISLRYHSDVMRPYSSRAMAYWISQNPHVVQGKRVLDMGCGTGIQGIVSMKVGADHVEFVDVMSKAIDISKLNVRKNLDTQSGMRFVRSDLFEALSDSTKYDVILFAQPYFSGHPLAEAPCTFGMLMHVSRIERFMREAHDRLADRGCLLMPCWDFGSRENDPRVLAGRFGWRLEARLALDKIAQPVQQGAFELAVLTH
jgi:SAM-dependent methyltransferase